MTLDKIDKAILDIIQRNAKSTIKEMASQLNLSTTPVFDRIKKMEQKGIIKNYVAILDSALLEKKLTVFIMISLKEHGKDAINNFVEAIIEFPVVLECHHISGDADFILKLIMKDIEEYNDFIMNELSSINNIGKVESRFSLSVRKNTHHIPVT